MHCHVLCRNSNCHVECGKIVGCHVVYMKTNCYVGCRNTVTLGVGTQSVMLGILTLSWKT